MVSAVESIKKEDSDICTQLNSFAEWENKVEFICSLSTNEPKALKGKKVQRCSNNAYLFEYDGSDSDYGIFYVHSDSRLVTGLMNIFSSYYSMANIQAERSYQPKFIDLLKEIVSPQTVDNLTEAFKR
jgi:sulfur transfer protein SufE